MLSMRNRRRQRRDTGRPVRPAACGVRQVLAGALGALLLAMPASAQTFDYVGPNGCINCHDHEDEKEWWQKVDGPPPLGHVNALQQMEHVDSRKYAAAVGLDASDAGVYDLEGSCVACHATVFKGDANAGVSCESCHGPGSGYLDSHQDDNSYQDSLTKGMLDVIGNLQNWANGCVTCHVTDDQRLIDAGHPSGDEFTLSDKFDVVARHWSNEYQQQAVDAAAAARRREIIARRRGPAEARVTDNTAAPALAPPTSEDTASPAPPATAPVAPPPANGAPLAPAPTTPVVPTPVPEATARPAPAAARPAVVAAPPPPPPPTSEIVVIMDQPVPVPQSPAALVAALQGRSPPARWQPGARRVVRIAPVGREGP